MEGDLPVYFNYTNRNNMDWLINSFHIYIIISIYFNPASPC